MSCEGNGANMPLISVKTTRTLLETENQLGKQFRKISRKQLEKESQNNSEELTDRTVLAIAFVVMTYLKREIEYWRHYQDLNKLT